MIPLEIERRINLALATLYLLVLAVPPCMAQQNSEPKTAHAEAKVLNVGHGLLQVQNLNDGAVWILRPGGRAAEITHIAKAKKAWLCPKMIIRVEGTFDQKGVGQNPIKSLQVFTPRPEYQLGVFSDSGESVRSRGELQSLIVAGLVTKREGDTLRISAARRSFTVELAPEVEIDVDLLGDLSWVRPGDNVDYSAMYFNQGQGLATKLKVESRQPLEPVDKPKRATRKRRGNPRQSAENVATIETESATQEAAAEPQDASKEADDGAI